MTNIHSIRFFIKETFTGLCRSGLMSLVAIATVTITLIVLGMFLLISANLSKVTDDIVSKLEIRIFLKSNLKIEDIQLFKRKLRAIDGIKNVTFINSNTAWKDFKQDYKHLNFTEYVAENPLPHSLNVKLKKSQNIKPVILYLKRFDTLIDDIVYGGELADRVDVFRKFMFISGWSLIVLLILASLFIIVNTIRLTVIARQEEISIMRLVGATDTFIKCPFLLEGFVIGCIGGATSVGFLYLIYSLLIQQAIQKMPFIPFVTNTTSLYYIYGFVLGIGTIIGTLGAYISVTRSLKTR
jgi:cell division transport system permease protein